MRLSPLIAGYAILLSQAPTNDSGTVTISLSCSLSCRRGGPFKIGEAIPLQVTFTECILKLDRAERQEGAAAPDAEPSADDMLFCGHVFAMLAGATPLVCLGVYKVSRRGFRGTVAQQVRDQALSQLRWPATFRRS
jgi:hypothetical protein